MEDNKINNENDDSLLTNKILEAVKHQKDIISSLIALLSLLAVLLAVSNLFFNLGYFSLTDFKYMGILTLPDYYEGTAPLLVFALTVFIFFFNVTTEKTKMVLYTPDVMYCLLNAFIILPLLLLYTMFLYFLKKVLYFGKITYIEKRKIASMRKRLKLLKRKYKEVLIKILKMIAMFICLLLFLLYPIWLFYNEIYKLAPALFNSVMFFWCIFAVSNIFIKQKYKSILTIITAVVVLYIAGQWAYVKNVSNIDNIAYTTWNEKYVLVRSVSKGILSINSDGMFTFIPWNNIEKISKSLINIKEKETK